MRVQALRPGLALVAACLLAACTAGEPALRPGDHAAGIVRWVYDGDSLSVLVDGAELDLRLWGVDAPEREQRGANAARDDLRDLLAGRRIELAVEDVDDYGRLVAVVSLDGAEVNRRQLRRGHAWWYRRYAPDAEGYAEAEWAARTAGRGLWADPDPVPPWEFRRTRRDE